jgi:hypothetical protein
MTSPASRPRRRARRSDKSQSILPILLEAFADGKARHVSPAEAETGRTRPALIGVPFRTEYLKPAPDRGRDATAFGVLAGKPDSAAGTNGGLLISRFGYIAGKERNAIVQGEVKGKFDTA